MTRRLRRRRTEGDAGFALVLMMLLILVLGTISLTVLSLLLNQLRPTQVAGKRVDTVNSAAAGLEAALSQLRAATTTSGAGNPGKLPCSLTGRVDGDATDTYAVRIRYFPLGRDPATMTATQRTAKELLPCPLQNVVPGFALLENAGVSTRQPTGRADRDLEATYVLSRTNQHPSGGRMRNSSLSMCWDAGAAPVTAGRPVTWRPCGAVNEPRQLWTFRPDLSLFFAGAPGDTPLCVDDSAFFAQTASPRPAAAMTLQNCLEPDPGQVGTYPYSPPAERFQEFSPHLFWWAVSDDGDGKAAGHCIGPSNASVTAGAPVVLTLPGSGNSACGTLRPDNAVGAGQAAATLSGVPGPTKQLVNYAQFASCLDVEGSDPARRLIAWPCHSAPLISKIEANQQFSFSGSAGGRGTLSTTRPGFYTTKCLTSPGATVGAWVTLANCTGAAAQDWLFTGRVAGDYIGSYTVQDSSGLCLAFAPRDGYPHVYAVVQTCNGGDGQKWNAPAGLINSALVSLVETTGR